MRILHVLPSMNAVTGGPVKAVLLQLRELARLGHEVELYTTLWPEMEAGPGARLIERDGYLTRVFPASLPWPGAHVPYSRELAGALREAGQQFDIHHVSSLWNPLATRAMATLRRAGRPYAITCHGMLDPEVFARRGLAKRAWALVWERANVEGAGLLHFTSEQEMRKAQRCGWRLPAGLVVPLNVEVEEGDRLPPRDMLEREFPQVGGREVIAFVGRLNWVKNLDLLVQALSRLRAQGRDAMLLCVGPDSEGTQERLARLAASLGVADRVVFTGMREGEAVRAVWARADVAALVSRKENFGLAAAEALCAGIPLVLSDGVDLGQQWGAPPVWRVRQDPDSIARGLALALDYARQVGLPSQAARELALREWGRPEVWRLAEAYEKMLAARQRATAGQPLERAGK